MTVTGDREHPKPSRSTEQSDPAHPRIRVTRRFEKAYAKLPDDVRERIDTALRRFIDNPRHPGLHFEKLSGSVYRTIRPDRKIYRIVLRDLGGHEYELVDVARHAVVDAKYG